MQPAPRPQTHTIRPPAVHHATACVTSSVTYEDWAAIVKKAAEQARRGDAKAREWLSDHLVGKPDENMSGNLAIVVRHEGNNPDPSGAA